MRSLKAVLILFFAGAGFVVGALLFFVWLLLPKSFRTKIENHFDDMKKDFLNSRRL